MEKENQRVNTEFPSCDFYHTQVAMVADIGGTSLDDSVRRMMAFIITSALSLQYNLFGHRGKKKFRDLPLFNVIYGKLEFLIGHCNSFCIFLSLKIFMPLFI